MVKINAVQEHALRRPALKSTSFPLPLAVHGALSGRAAGVGSRGQAPRSSAGATPRGVERWWLEVNAKGSKTRLVPATDELELAR
nr:hypothetical protein [Cupriavidus lacunae]